MPLGQRHAVHVAGPFRQPVVHRAHDGEDRAGHQHVVEVRDDEVGLVVLEIDGDDGEHHAGKPPMVNRNRNEIANSMGGSKDNEPRHMVAVQLNTFTPVGTAISMVDIM